MVFDSWDITGVSAYMLVSLTLSFFLTIFSTHMIMGIADDLKFFFTHHSCIMD